MGKTNDWLDFDQLAEEKVRDALKPPSMYKVILVNDDYTPMEFVIDVLQKFFSYDVERATQLMLAVHHRHFGFCNLGGKDSANGLPLVVNKYARENEHPLLCTLEKA
ncbi:ATP-dependent Clp protease adapter ClpS [Escherichia sp. TWPC-MK]